MPAGVAVSEGKGAMFRMPGGHQTTSREGETSGPYRRFLSACDWDDIDLMPHPDDGTGGTGPRERAG